MNPGNIGGVAAEIRAAEDVAEKRGYKRACEDIAAFDDGVKRDYDAELAAARAEGHAAGVAEERERAYDITKVFERRYTRRNEPSAEQLALRQLAAAIQKGE
jgi:hypothetical protein